jgi:hypothetical protein
VQANILLLRMMSPRPTDRRDPKNLNPTRQSLIEKKRIMA